MAQHFVPAPELVAASLLSCGRTPRTDGRGSSEDFRRLKVRVHSLGSVEVWMGGTRVSASVQSKLTAPRPERPNQGEIKFSCEVSGLAGPEFQDGLFQRTTAHARSCTQKQLALLLEKLFKGSRAVEEESLCIIPGESCWVLGVEVRVLCNDGNLGDCCCLAALFALLTFRVERVEVAEGGVEVAEGGETDETGERPDDADNSTSSEDKFPDPKRRRTAQTIHKTEQEPLALTVHHYPIPTTFSFLPRAAHLNAAQEHTTNQRRLLGLPPDELALDHIVSSTTNTHICDATLAEINVCQGSLTLAVNQFDELCLMEAAGCHAPAIELLTVHLPIARRRTREVLTFVESTLKNFEADRQAIRSKQGSSGVLEYAEEAVRA